MNNYFDVLQVSGLSFKRPEQALSKNTFWRTQGVPGYVPGLGDFWFLDFDFRLSTSNFFSDFRLFRLQKGPTFDSTFDFCENNEKTLKFSKNAIFSQNFFKMRFLAYFCLLFAFIVVLCVLLLFPKFYVFFSQKVAHFVTFLTKRWAYLIWNFKIFENWDRFVKNPLNFKHKI